MANIIKIVLELFHCVLVALTVRVIYLRPTRDSRFHQVPEMIERNFFLITLGTFYPLRSRTDQAHLAAKHVPKLRQFIQAQLSEPESQSQQTPIVAARINIFWLFG